MDRSDARRTRLVASTAVLAVTQVVHGAIPSGTSSKSYVGLVVGLALLVAAIVAVVGAVRRRTWAPTLAIVAGSGVAVGFVLYHATPVHSPLTNPYVGEHVSTASWASVAVCVAAGAWAAFEGYTARRAAEPGTLGAT